MSEYRSELLAVNERITGLEAELARLPPREGDKKPRFSIARLLIVLVVTLLAGAMLWMYVAAGLSEVYLARREEVLTSPQLPADPPRPRTGMIWLPEESHVGSQGQTFLDVDGDGKAELIGLAWDREVADLGPGLHVVALDARTLRPRWTSAAYSGHRVRAPESVEHLVVMPAGVLVSDAHGVVHLLDPATGKQRSEVAPGFPVDAACPAPDGSPRALVARQGIPWSESPGPLVGMMTHEIARIQNVLIDPATGTTTKASIHTFCDWSDYCARNEEHGCRVLREQADAPRKTALDVSAYDVFRDGDARVGVGFVNLDTVGDDGVPQRYVAARWSATTRDIVWKTPLTMRGGLHHVDSALGGETFVVVDEGPDGPGRFRALDAKTGAIRFERELDHAGIGTRVISLFAHGDGVYVARDGRLDCYDASTGALLGRSDAP